MSTNTAIVANPTQHDVITVTDATISGSTTAFNVLGALDHFTVSSPGTVTVGQTFTEKVTAKDSLGDTIVSYTGPATLSDATNSLSPTAASAFSKGVSTTNVSIASPQKGDKIEVIGSDHDGSAVTSYSAAFTVKAGSPSPGGA
ncbi:MAG TPA: hypothetical protein VG650_06240 [Mycobacteriales bacterium]|nr:hypothetical protein [Mycobacteriales bacterium]